MVMKKYFILFLLLLISTASAVDVNPPLVFAGNTTSVTLNYSTTVDALTFYSQNNTLVMDDISHQFTTTGTMNVTFNGLLELTHTGSTGTWTVGGLQDGNYSLYIDDSFYETISNGDAVSLNSIAKYEIQPADDVMTLNMTYWEPLNETCAKFTISNVYTAWYPQLSYTVADHTYFLYRDSTGTLLATNATTSTNQTITLIGDSILTSGNYTITHILTSLVGVTVPEITSYSPSTPSFSILPSGQTSQRTFTISSANDPNLDVKWYYGDKFYSSYANDENYISTYGYTLVDTVEVNSTSTTHTFTTDEPETIGVIARLMNESSGLYEDKIWNWVVQEPDFDESMEYSSVPTEKPNTIILTSSNEHISSVILEYEIDGEYTNVTMESTYSNYEYGETINNETSYTYTEIFECEINPMEEGTYNIASYYVTQDGVQYSIDGNLEFTAAVDGSTVQYTTRSSGGSSSGGSGGSSKTTQTQEIIEKLVVKDGVETFKKTSEHSLYSVSSSDESFTVLVKDIDSELEDESVYKEMDISTTENETVDITFLVDTSWLNENGGSVKLLHYTNDEWVEVPVKMLSKTDDYVKYGATLTSYSPYAIVASNANVGTSTSDSDVGTYIIIAVLVIGALAYLRFKPRSKKPFSLKSLNKTKQKSKPKKRNWTEL
jgi:PGF-pre-PGF domain-containing protein